jgi:gluconokinase
MAFTSLLHPTETGSEFALRVATSRHPCAGRPQLRATGLQGAWQQVVIGMDSTSVVLGYPVALLHCLPCCAVPPLA